MAVHLSFLFVGLLAKYRGITAETLAAAMIGAVQKGYKGIETVENLEIPLLAMG
jgi:hypothetical protein